MNNMILRIFFLLTIYFSKIESFNKTVIFNDVVDCIELQLEEKKHYYTDIVIPIENLCFNQRRFDEILRMKTFFLGSDFYIEMMSNSNKPIYYNPKIRFYHTVLGGWEGKKSKISISALNGPGLTCGSTDTANLLHKFYFTELEIVIKKHGLVQYFEYGFLRFECQLEPINVTHLAFGIGELGDGRVFYDCP
ncbi:hypothetical protein ACFFRR_000675 [Megaselia abdita]